MCIKLPLRGVRPRPKRDEIGFVITCYRPHHDFPIERFPDCCPYLELDPTAPCEIRLHHLRERKTGPVPVLVVCECLTHGRSFTVYPYGAGPYLRIRFSPVGTGGETLFVEEETPQSPAASRENSEEASSATSRERSKKASSPAQELSPKVQAYLPTYSGSAVDESRGVLWPTGAAWQEPPGNTQPRRETQVCRSLRTLRIFGVDSSEVDEPDRRHISDLLGTSVTALQALEDGLRRNGDMGAPRARGEAVCSVIETLPDLDPPCLAHRFAVAGYLAGIWGLPWAFDNDAGTFTTEPFRRGGRVVVQM